MKKTITYKINPDLKRFARIRVGNAKVTALILMLYNGFAALSVAFFRAPRNMIRTKYRIQGYQREIRLTVYETKTQSKQSLPCLVYYHGGGFITRDTHHLHHNLCAYAAQVPCKVVLVNYSLAPKYPFPIGLYDCYGSLIWVENNAELLGVDATNISVGGDSAGANLATSVAQMARNLGGPRLRAQLLLYPATDKSMATQSIADLADCPMCNPSLLKQMWAFYLKDGDFDMPHYVSPAQAPSLADLPPAYIETAEFDSLKDEGKAYAEKLNAAGVAVVLNETKGTFHAYDVAFKSASAQRAVAQRVAFIKKYTGYALSALKNIRAHGRSPNHKKD